jgi:hypothetical protein
VLGSYLAVTAATLLAKTVTDLPRVRQLGARLLRAPLPGDAPRPSDADTDPLRHR